MFYQIFSEKKIFTNMTIQEAKQILAENGRSTCSCKYGGDEGRMIAEAIKIKESQESKK
jgi:hypothetical protein